MTSSADVRHHKICNSTHTTSKLMTSLNKSPPVWGMQTTALMKNNVNSSRNGDASDKDIDKVDAGVVEKRL